MASTTNGEEHEVVQAEIEYMGKVFEDKTGWASRTRYILNHLEGYEVNRRF